MAATKQTEELDMSKTRIMIELCMPESGTERQGVPPQSLAEHIRDTVRLLQDSNKPEIHVLRLSKIYKSLRNRKLSPETKQLMGLIEPALKRFGGVR